MGKWFQEYEEQLEGYQDEMGSKNKGKAYPPLLYTPTPPKPKSEDQGGKYILIFGFLLLALITWLGYYKYEPKRPLNLDQTTEELSQAQEDYIKEYGIKNEDQDTDK